MTLNAEIAAIAVGSVKLDATSVIAGTISAALSAALLVMLAAVLGY